MSSRKDLGPELADIQARLGDNRGPKFWRGLEELANSPAFQELIQREFPEQAAGILDAVSRRQFLTLMGASLALAGLSGCSTRPAASREVVPYVRAPEEIVPGKPLFYATTMMLGSAATGLLVESHMGRPTKIEGNPNHPASLGATDLFNQASILTLYDPDRSKTVTFLGQTSTWEAAFGELSVRGQPSIGMAIKEQQQKQGEGLRILTETILSPTLAHQMERVLKAYPKAIWHQYEPITRDQIRQASMLAFGKQLNTYYDFRKADVVLSLDDDFLTCGPGCLHYVADFMSRRRIRASASEAAKAEMNRLYVVETAVSNTGAKADHRLPVRLAEVEVVARDLAVQLGLQTGGSGDSDRFTNWIAAAARDLEKHRRRCLVLVGERQPAVVHLLAHALNERLGNIGQTVFYTEPVEAQPTDQIQSLRDLTLAMDGGHVELLLILGGNPAFTAPADFHFVDRMQKVPLRAHLSLFQDETSRQCHWHLPQTHYLEEWSDARTFDGTASIVQPLIAPLYHGRSTHELLSVLTDQLWVPGYETLRAYWRDHWKNLGGSGDFEDFWQSSVHDGIVAGTEFRHQTVPLKKDWQEHLKTPGGAARQDLELVFQSDPTIYDGRFANNAWLQELPKPVTKLTWDNAALMSPRTARELGLGAGLGSYAHGGEHGGYVQPLLELRIDDRSVRAPLWVMPGHADGAVTVYLGYGRQHAGRVGGSDGQFVGFNAYTLRTSEHLWSVPGLEITKTGEKYAIACTQAHHLMENRDLVRTGTLQKFHDRPEFAKEGDEAAEKEKAVGIRKSLNLYEPYDYEPPKNKWGMAIDLSSCTGCSACIVACQAENNIPVVGKDQVLAGREMHWLRVDRYFLGPADAPREYYFQPVPCMHCENAPCEYVCPVEATVHSAEGLNEMIYQRCVGTRFCSNNCPYKVRRFNFFSYADYTTESLRQQYNPNVTVRSRGVMEKCSYCVQRIRQAGIGAQAEGRGIAEGEVLTACQAACPAQAIIFGDINNPGSAVRQLKQSPLNYGLLTDLNTEPRTTYLAALRNPNPEIPGVETE
jgi:molybdopterin-containing oxidoreductase family iron-sulfur binding subunit